MKNSFGCALTVTLFGESHGDMIGAVLDGLAPGIKIDDEYIRLRLDMRRPFGNISTKRREGDEYKIVSGAHGGYTTGTPLCILIPNEDTHSECYSAFSDTPRPSHADYTAGCKYHGYEDPRGGGHFSGRITAALVAAGAIAASALEARGVYIGTQLYSLGNLSARSFVDFDTDELCEAKRRLDSTGLAVLDEKLKSEMIKKIEAAAKVGDSVGGVLESCILGLPAGVGEPWFDSMESQIAHILFSIPGVKGVEFGRGFELTKMLGSEANDPFYTDGERIMTKTNNGGGISGGITSGMPITLRTAIKPTPSIYKEQDTVSLKKMTNEKLSITGRHDPAIVHRARAVVDAALALAVLDMLTVRYGTDYIVEK